MCYLITLTAAVRAQIERFQPDIVILEEINPRWRTELADLPTKYPHHLHDIRSDNFGIWVLSKYPLIEERVVYWGPARVPTIIFQYRVGEALVDVVATHPMSPGSAKGARWRDEQLRAIAKHYENTPNPLIIVGDLNTTSFAPTFKDVAQQLDLKDSRLGFGLQNSWPAWTWNPFMISLDHCLVSQRLYVTCRALGDNVGSDHLPVYVEVAHGR